MAAGALAAMALGVTASGASASRGDCDKAVAHHKVIGEDARGLVFTRNYVAYACSYRTGDTHRLPGQGKGEVDLGHGDRRGTWSVTDDPITGAMLRMAGGHAAYGLQWEEKLPDGSAPDTHATVRGRVVSYDFRHGTTKYATTPSDGEFTVSALVAKPNGSVAWVYDYAGQYGPLDQRVVKMDRATGGEERGLDSSERFDGGYYAIDYGSLALSDRRQEIYWSASNYQGDQTTHTTLHAPLR
ncbi:MAG: hypothetical protein ACJ760_10190 [Thermoleophilaceae bacterium]